MPRKIRELKAQIAREGFVYLPKRGKGSHERWRHPMLRKTLTIPGKDGDDVALYLEKQLAIVRTVFIGSNGLCSLDFAAPVDN